MSTYRYVGVLNVQNPLHPTIIGHIDIPGGARKIEVDSWSIFQPTYLYVLNASPTLYIIDVSNHTTPTLLSICQTGNNLRAIWYDDSKIYAANRDGLNIINVTDRSMPVQAAFFPDIHDISAVKAFDGYIYLTDNTGLKILRYTPTE